MELEQIGTNGWGAINAAEADVVNKSIAKQKKLPGGFVLESTGEMEGFEFTCTVCGSDSEKNTPCLWEKWEIVPGGSGAILYMSCELGTACLWSQCNDRLNKYDISQSRICISLNLKAVKDASYNIGGQTGTAYKLTAEEEDNVQVLDTSVFGRLDPKKNRIVIDLLKDGFKEYFTNNMKDFGAAFGVLMIGGKIAEKNEQFQWLMPTDISYAFEKAANGKCYFGILTMIDNDRITTQGQMLNLDVFGTIPEGANSVLMISAEKFCQHILLPAAVKIIKGSSAADFETGTDGISITNSKELKWGEFQIDENRTISPTLPKGSFTLKIQGDKIQVEILQMHYSPSPGITVYMNMSQAVQVKMVKTENGFVLVPDEDSAFASNTLNSTVVVAEWLKILELLLDIVSAVAALGFGMGKLGQKIAARISARVVSETVAEVVTASEEIASAAAEDAAETASEMAEAAAEVINGEVRTKGFFSSNYCSIATAICEGVLCAGGVSIATIELVKWCINNEYSKLPTLESFVKVLLGNYMWPSLADAQIVGGRLQDVLLIYTKIPTEDK